jgi:dihydrofolate synthase/folylpolyglutamate synthase
MSQTPSILDAKLNYLYSRTGGHTIKFGLETTLRLLKEAGADPLALPCVHVAGTNGKGSVSAMLESVFRQAGFKTGLYTSPHLIRFNERMRVDGRAVPDEELNRLLDAVELADREQAGQEGGRPGTFFELTTVAAVKWFLEQQVQMAVMETGLGGRLDSTNVVDPALSVITEIGLEHTAWLGNTIEEIAREKAGIIKPGRPVVLGRQKPAARAVLEARAREVGSKVLSADELVSVRRVSQDWDGQVVEVETQGGAWPRFKLPLLGDFQLENAATAICALEWLREVAGFPVSEEAVRAGLERVKWAGRCQVASRDPVFLVDVAHNPDGAEALARFLKPQKKKHPIVLVCGMLSDKDAAAFFRWMKPVVDACVLVPLDSERNMPMERLSAAAQQAGVPAVEGDLSGALRRAVKWARDRDGIVVSAGSLFLAAEVLYQLGVEV